MIRFPTNIASIVGRWACGGDDDLPAVHALQDATTLTVVDSTGNSAGLPVPEPGVSQDLLFLEKLRIWSQAFPPAPRDRELQDSFSPIRIDEPGASPYSSHSAASLSADEAAALADGLTIGEKNLLEALTKGSSPEVNGWKLTFHAFDYNLDYFEVGTIDDSQFKIADPKLRIVERAAAAKGRAVGQPPLRSGVHHDLRRRSGRAVERNPHLHNKTRPHSAGERLLVADDVLGAGTSSSWRTPSTDTRSATALQESSTTPTVR